MYKEKKLMTPHDSVTMCEGGNFSNLIFFFVFESNFKVNLKVKKFFYPSA